MKKQKAISIFEKEIKYKEKDLEYIVEKIKSKYNKRILHQHYLRNESNPYYEYSINQFLNKYVVDILNGIDLQHWETKNIDLINYIELFYSTFIWIIENDYDKWDIKRRNSNSEIIDIAFWKGIMNGIKNWLIDNNLEISEIQKNEKWKFINKDIAQITKELKNKDWREQFNLLFSEDNLIEKQKILSWFAEHATGPIRDWINSIPKSSNYFNSNATKALMKDLNNIYKHFNNDKKGILKEDYNNLINLEDSKKIEKMNSDGRLLLYLFVEYEREKSTQ